jgi:hypothetical protein
LRAYRDLALALPAALVDQLLARTVRRHGLRLASWLILSGTRLATRGLPAAVRDARRAAAAATLRAAIDRERRAGILPEVIAGRVLARAARDVAGRAARRFTSSAGGLLCAVAGWQFSCACSLFRPIVTG